MSASDLPESYTYHSARQMARKLVTYMACPYATQRVLKGYFSNVPGITSIEIMRRQYLARQTKPKSERISPLDRHDPQAEFDKLNKANQEFLRRLKRERAATEVLR